MSPRPATLIVTEQCSTCADRHQVIARIGGFPVIQCPTLKGDAMRFQAGAKAMMIGVPAVKAKE